MDRPISQFPIIASIHSTDTLPIVDNTGSPSVTKQVPMSMLDERFSAAAHKFCYLPAGWNDCWEAAKAASGSTPAHLSVIGDSVSQGKSLVTSWQGLIRSNLLNTYSLYGDFYPTVDSAAFVASGFTNPPFVFNRTSGLTFNDHGWAKLPGYNGATVGTDITFTTPYACTAIDIFYWDGAVGTFEYVVDGGSPVTVNCIEASDKVNKKISITGLANTTHVITFGNSSGVNTEVIMGCATYTGTTGIGFSRMATGAIQAQNYANTGTWPTEDRVIFFQGINPQKLPVVSPTGFGFPTQPDLAFIGFGINDCTASQTITSYNNIIRRFIQALRRGKENCSIILFGPSFPDNVNSDVTSGSTNSANWHNYLMAMFEMAAAYNCAFVNIHAKWGEYGYTNGFQAVNNLHPLDAGHADIASVINTII